MTLSPDAHKTALLCVAIRFWPNGRGAEPNAYQFVESLASVPRVGEHIDPGSPESVPFGSRPLYRIDRVVHLMKPAEDGRVVEVDAVIDRTHGF